MKQITVLMVKGAVLFFTCWMVRSTQFLQVCQKMCLLSLINVCVCCVWGDINFSVFEVDSLQEQENWKEQMLILEHGSYLINVSVCCACLGGA